MATVTEERAVLPLSFETESKPQLDFSRLTHLVAPWLVAIVAVGLAACLWGTFLPMSRELWAPLDHDRNTHYELGVNLALDIWHGNLSGLMHHLDGVRVWGPLHGIVLGLMQLVCGPDFRFGVLPSLLSWVATAVLGFLVTRRLLPQKGNIAGLLAAMFILISPGHRAFATDVMLESLGAALTLFCLHRYLIAVQDDAPRRGVWLGLGLTLLFLAKSNYWILVMVGLTAGECLRQPRLAYHIATSCWQIVNKREWWVGQVRNPWNYLLAALIGVIFAMLKWGGATVDTGTFQISLNRPHNLVFLAYLTVVIRILIWWRRQGVSVKLARGNAVFRELVYWHAWPIAIYFMLPKRLASFIWYVSPANRDVGRGGDLGILDGVAYYFQAICQGYHVYAWTAIVMLAFLLLGLAMLRRWQPGAIGIASFFCLAAFATCQHPMLKHRLVHTWIPVLWIMGSAACIGLLVRLLKSTRRVSYAGLALCAAVAVMHGPYWTAPGHAQEGGVRPDTLTTLVDAEAFLPSLGNVRNPTLLCNVYTPSFLSWTYQEAYGRKRFSTEIKGYSSKRADVETIASWAGSTSSEGLVLIEVADDSPHFAWTPTNLDLALVRRYFTENDTSFQLAAEWRLPHKVRITLWTKRQPAVAAAPR